MTKREPKSPLGRVNEEKANKLAKIRKKPKLDTDPYLDLIYGNLPIAVPDFHKRYKTDQGVKKLPIKYLKVDQLTKTICVKLAYREANNDYLVRLDYAIDPTVIRMLTRVTSYLDKNKSIFKPNTNQGNIRNIYFKDTVNVFKMGKAFEDITSILRESILKLKADGGNI